MAQLSRRMSPLTLFLLCINGMVGSGWLFAPLYAAKIAGSAVIFSWLIGGFAAILISLTFAELSAMLPVAGGTAHVPQLSHGPFASFTLSWIAWIISLLLAPIEVQAVLQYASLSYPALMHVVDGVPVLAAWGYFWAAFLMITLCVLNVVSYNGLIKFNFVLCIFKFGVMILAVALIFKARFTPANFAGMGEAVMSKQGWQAIFSGVATGGIVLAFNGFKSGVELAGEAKKLSIAIPLSTVGAVIACLFLYLGLQICFIGALDPALLKGGWQNLAFSGDIGPFVGLATGLGLVLLVKLLYANAVIAPLGAGLIYVTATARILYAMSKIGYVPKFLSRLNKQHFPVWAIVVNFTLGMLAFLPLPGWQGMVNFLISAVVITYAMGPIAVMCLRLTLPDKERPFRLPAANLICFAAFYCCNLFSYWTGWETIGKLSIALMIGLGLFLISYARGTVKMSLMELKSALWIIPYICGLIGISYLGAFGGKNIITFGWDFLVIALFSLVILGLALKTRVALNLQDVKDLLISEGSMAVESR
tara:strand:- start:586 stop:2187 length:1602 start_codon:yes stop_codon:yes gene_type:complete